MDDLEDIAGYISEDNPDAVRHIVSRLWTAVRTLAKQPEIGRQAYVNGTRELVVGSQKTTAFLRAATKYRSQAGFDRNLQVIKILLYHGADKNYRSDDSYFKDRTALEFLKEERGKAVERIKLIRYEEKQRLAEENLLIHRDTIIRLLEN